MCASAGGGGSGDCGATAADVATTRIHSHMCIVLLLYVVMHSLCVRLHFHDNNNKLFSVYDLASCK